jgi:hypothetical protein
MKALVLAQGDAAEGKLTSEKQQAICDTVNEIIEVLSDYQDTDPIDDDSASEEKPIAEAMSTRPESTGSVLCVPSRSSLDEAACDQGGRAADRNPSKRQDAFGRCARCTIGLPLLFRING